MNKRMVAAIVLTAVLVTIIYVLSIVPYLFTTDKPAPSNFPILEMMIPASAFLIIAVLVFLVPKRKKINKQPVAVEGEESGTVPKGSKQDIAEHKHRIRSFRSGAIAGFGAAIVLVGLVFVGNSMLGLPPGTFYSIVGIAMAGLNPPAAIYFGVALHLIVGTVIGAVFGYLTTVIGPFNITGLAKGAGVGVLAGFVSFSVLFIPLTRFEVEPSLQRILVSLYPAETNSIALEGKVVNLMSTVLAGAVVLHVVYGAIMGAGTAILLGYWPLSKERREEMKNKRTSQDFTAGGSSSGSSSDHVAEA